MVFGDFGTHLQKVLESRVRSAFSNKTIGDVNAILDELAAADGIDSKLIVFLFINISHEIQIMERNLILFVDRF